MNNNRNSSKIFNSILRAFFFFTGLCLTFMIVSVCLDVILRNFFNVPIQWVTEITEYLMLVILFFGAAWVLNEEGHVEMDIIITHLDIWVQYLLKYITSILGFLLCLILSFYGMITALDHYRRNIYYPTLLEFPKAPIFVIIALGFFFLAVQFFRRTLKYRRLLRK